MAVSITKTKPTTKGKKKGQYEDHLAPSEHKGGSGKWQTEKVQTKNGTPMTEQYEEGEIPGIVVPAHKLAHLSIQGGRTINLGNYESVKVSVTLTLPTHVDFVEDAYDFATQWVSDKVEELTTAASA